MPKWIKTILDSWPGRFLTRTVERYLFHGVAQEAAALAYEKTVVKCREFKWSYCNGILRRWHEAGLHTLDEIEAGDKRPKPEEAISVRTASGKAAGNAWMRKYIQQRRKEE